MYMLQLMQIDQIYPQQLKIICFTYVLMDHTSQYLEHNLVELESKYKVFLFEIRFENVVCQLYRLFI